MKLGIRLTFLPPKHWIEVARLAEERGLDSIWVPDHLVLPEEMTGSPLGGDRAAPISATLPVYDAFLALTWIAANTSTLRLGTCVYNIGLRHPFITARTVSTLGTLSQRRVLFGVGAGWLREEWTATGLDFEGRATRIDEALEVCHRLWTEGAVEHHGAHFDFAPVHFEPKTRTPPEVWVGGDSTAAMRRVARFGDGWLPMNLPARRAAERIAVLQRLWAEEGRAGKAAVTVQVGTPSLNDVECYARCGVERLIVYPFRQGQPPVQSLNDYLDRVATMLPQSRRKTAVDISSAALIECE